METTYEKTFISNMRELEYAELDRQYDHMRNVVDPIFREVDPHMQAKLDLCTSLETILGIRIQYDE